MGRAGSGREERGRRNRRIRPRRKRRRRGGGGGKGTRKRRTTTMAGRITRRITRRGRTTRLAWVRLSIRHGPEALDDAAAPFLCETKP